MVEVGDFSQAVAVDAVAVDAVDADCECDEVAVVFSAVAVVSDD